MRPFVVGSSKVGGSDPFGAGSGAPPVSGSAWDMRPSLDPLFRIFGVAANVTPADGAMIAVTAIWDRGGARGRSLGDLLNGVQHPGEDPRPRVALRRDQVSELPPGSTIALPDVAGGEVSTRTVERVDYSDPELLYAVVE